MSAAGVFQVLLEGLMGNIVAMFAEGQLQLT
jgi:hypothetical protein